MPCFDYPFGLCSLPPLQSAAPLHVSNHIVVVNFVKNKRKKSSISSFSRYNEEDDGLFVCIRLFNCSGIFRVIFLFTPASFSDFLNYLIYFCRRTPPTLSCCCNRFFISSIGPPCSPDVVLSHGFFIIFQDTSFTLLLLLAFLPYPTGKTFLQFYFLTSHAVP